jgi:hypothetical protein
MLGSLIAGFLSGEAFDVARRARRAAVVYLLAGIFALVGLGFLVGAGYIAVARRVGPLEAALWFGGGFLLVAVVVAGVHLIIAGRRRRKAARKRNVDMAAIAGAAALSALPSLLRSKAGIGVIAGPALAILAYAIYRENSRDPEEGDHEGDRPD